MTLSSEAERLLDAVERRELRLLSWGVVDGAFTECEVQEIYNALNGVERTLNDSKLELLASRMLIPVRGNGENVYRSRSAETVRLASRLKQWLHGKPWSAAPNLVADFRFSSRERVFPRRDQSIDVLINSVPDGPNAAWLASVEQRLRTMVGQRHLSQFQVDATVQIATDLLSDTSRGSVICAGTGSGKTLCFYLPILSILGSPLAADNWTRVLALYPRNELLKDQFSNALGWVRSLQDNVAAGCRSVRVGALFGATPHNAEMVAEGHQRWERKGEGFVCPFARCPVCDAELIWLNVDRLAARERLRCFKQRCGFEVKEDCIILTRDRMQQVRPDLLFTTTEMLNRHMVNPFMEKLFGVNADRPPRAVLLDELHTYDGIHGAHVAHLLRRWRHAIGTRHAVQFTGLSATLLNAREFLAAMTGLSPGDVSLIEPKPEHCIRRGLHYQLALRGDPVSATALLSTTIQTSMLFGRMLDPLVQPPSDGPSGSKVFVFTDDLDATHRLYANLQSAEGRPTRPWQQANPPLASLRSGYAPDGPSRSRAGQNWSVCESIGHDLHEPLVVDLTSSLSRGVDPRAQVVVATASLEVGYDDNRVGAVIQHKAPRGAAAFLQRMGRAGRTQEMRPWSVIVLSDYGRDRLAYQRYESLFDPQLPARTLPIRNRSVLRIQAAFAFMDWLGSLPMRNGKRVVAWSELSRPGGDLQGELAKLINEVLCDTNGRRGELETYIAKALALDEREVMSVMWEEPRSLMYSVLPTTYRRLKGKWYRSASQGQGAGTETFYNYQPLPEFVPGQLFGDLNLPEVKVAVPRKGDGQSEDANRTTMPVVQAMRAFAPGKVSRRFVVDHQANSQWVALPRIGGSVAMEVDAFCPEYEEIGEAQYLSEGDVVQCKLIRPWTIQLADVPANIQPQSNAMLVWRSQLSPVTETKAWTTPPGSGWANVVCGMRFCTHVEGTQASVRRFAIGVDATTRQVRQDNELVTKVSFVSAEGSKVSVGFEFEADAIMVEVKVPEDLDVRWRDRSDHASRSMRTAYFRSCVMNDPALEEHANVFLRDRLVEVFLSGATAWAVLKSFPLQDAVGAMQQAGMAAVAAKVLDAIFQAMDVQEMDADGVVGDDGQGGGNAAAQGAANGADAARLVQKINQAFQAPQVQAILLRHAEVLWCSLDGERREHFREWLRQRYLATLGQGLLAAVRTMCPQTDAGDLFLDVDPGVRDAGGPPRTVGVEEVWLSEELPGGTGIVEEFAREYSADPRRFFSLLEAALAPAEFEVVDTQLTRTVRLANEDQEVEDAFREFREAIGHEQGVERAERVLTLLASKGVRTTPSVRSALFARVLRPGTGRETDALLSKLIELRETHERNLGIEIDARVFAHVAGGLQEVQTDLDRVVHGALQGNHAWYIQQVQSLLWPRGAALRANALTSYQPFASTAESDRLLLEGVGETTLEVKVGEVDWRDRLAEGLRRVGIVRLVAPQAECSRLRDALLQLATSPIEVGFMTLHPRPTRTTFDNGSVSVTLRLREVL
jgi:hypothetical protein